MVWFATPQNGWEYGIGIWYQAAKCWLIHAGPCVPPLHPDAVSDFVSLSDARRAPAMREALEEIRRGKTHSDNKHQLGEYAGMAMRFHKIATDALADKGTP